MIESAAPPAGSARFPARWNVSKEGRPRGTRHLLSTCSTSSLNSLLSLVAAALLIALGSSHCRAQQLPTIADIRANQQSGDFQAAYVELMRLSSLSTDDLSMELVLLARTGKQTLESDQLDRLYQRGIDALEKHPAGPDNADRRLVVRIAAAQYYLEKKSGWLAAKLLATALAEASILNSHVQTNRIQSAAQLSLQIAWKELESKRPENAESLYRSVLTVTAPGTTSTPIQIDRSVALLGLGWSLASQTERQAEAAKVLEQFVADFPEHPDVANAAYLRIHCMDPVQNGDTFAAAVESFLAQFAEHPVAAKVAQRILTSKGYTPRDSTRQAVQTWISQENQPSQWPPELIAAALTELGGSLSGETLSRLGDALIAADETGVHYAKVLKQLAADDHGKVAESLARAVLIQPDAAHHANVLDSICRWAESTERWGLLVEASKSIDVEDSTDKLSDDAIRAIAESLTQTRDTAEALRWWSLLVDQRAANDFPTLVRCAEATMAIGTTEQCRARLAQVRQLIDQPDQPASGPRAAMLHLLEAEVAIRDLKFDQARSRFEQAIRQPGAPASLRGRAQWMIGETFVMQAKYAEAIQAYRRVEGMDPSGVFVAAALVQAGKAFEQLGRTQEAGICYGRLLDRFGESYYAAEARFRMASLPLPGNHRTNPGDASPPNSPSAGNNSIKR